MSYDVAALIQEALDLRFFHPDEAIEGRTAIPALYDPGQSNLCLVQGENAGGKSFFRRVIQALTHKDKKDSPHRIDDWIIISMQGRTDTGLLYPPIMRAMIYGDEEHFATGDLTAETVTKAIRSVQGRQPTEKVLIYWDEPDVGLSTRAAAGAGVAIRELVESKLPQLAAVFVTSHSPALVNQLLKGQEKPHYLYLGDPNGPRDAAAWIADQLNVEVAPRPLADIGAVGHQRFRDLTAILKTKPDH